MEVKGRCIWECANQLGGYVDERTDEKLLKFLIRESDAANDLAEEIVRLHSELNEARELLKIVLAGECVNMCYVAPRHIERIKKLVGEA